MSSGVFLNEKDQMFLNANAESALQPQKRIKLRDKYILERELIKKEFGSLNQILEKLGISQRRACQLLLVDPSAWTRWNKSEAPPHVYQALKWLLHLKDLKPQMIQAPDLSNRLDLVQKSSNSKFKQIEESISVLEKSINNNSQTIYFDPAMACYRFVSPKALKDSLLHPIASLQYKAKDSVGCF